MFKKILVALDHSKSDSVLLPRVKELCRLTNASLLLLHVSTGWKASWQRDLNLTDSLEMEEDRDYLREVERSLRRKALRWTPGMLPAMRPMPSSGPHEKKTAT